MFQIEFNTQFRQRTKTLAIDIIKLYGSLQKSDELRIIGKQLIRSATSTAANFRAACRARSKAERYSKMCIVVEEADETVFWLEVLKDLGILQGQLQDIEKEAMEILKVMATSRRKLKPK